MKLIVFKKRFVTIFLLFSVIILSFSSYFSYKYLKNKDIINENKIDFIPYNENIDFNTQEINEKDESKERKILLKEKHKEKKLIALTFDDGPSKYTKDLIDELIKRNITVTFFVLGENVNKYPEILKFASDAGNEIGIHSYEHKLFTKLSENEIIEEINKAHETIKKYLNIPISLIRVPYGSTNSKVDTILTNLNLTNILWTVDSKDWKLKNTKKIYSYVLKYIKGNDIILMHDTFKTSIDAAINIIDFLTEKGYIFVTVTELLEVNK